MVITGVVNKDEASKVKAIFSLEVQGIRLNGFKLCEDKKGLLFLAMPQKYLGEENGKANYSHPIKLNPNISNKERLVKDLTKTLVELYENKKSIAKLNKNDDGKIKYELSYPKLEEGQLKVISTYINNRKNNLEAQVERDIETKANQTVVVGAFQINNIYLNYDKITNDFLVNTPYYKKEDGSYKHFAVPTNDAYFNFKKILVRAFNDKRSENYQEMQKNKIANQVKQDIETSKNKNVEKQDEKQEEKEVSVMK